MPICICPVVNKHSLICNLVNCILWDIFRTLPYSESLHIQNSSYIQNFVKAYSGIFWMLCNACIVQNPVIFRTLTLFIGVYSCIFNNDNHRSKLTVFQTFLMFPFNCRFKGLRCYLKSTHHRYFSRILLKPFVVFCYTLKFREYLLSREFKELFHSAICCKCISS